MKSEHRLEQYLQTVIDEHLDKMDPSDADLTEDEMGYLLNKYAWIVTNEDK